MVFGLRIADLLSFSLLTEADAGHSEFTDEVYQNESRYPGGEWKQSDETYTDVVSNGSSLEINVVLSDLCAYLIKARSNAYIAVSHSIQSFHCSCLSVL